MNPPAPTFEQRLEQMEAALADGWADLETWLGPQHASSRVRLMAGQVLADWELDDQAGGCLLRPALVRRLVLLHGDVRDESKIVTVTAGRRTLAALSPRHAALVASLGSLPDLSFALRLQFDRRTGQYTGGEEAYGVAISGRATRPVSQNVLVRVKAVVHPGIPPGKWKRTSPGPL